MTRQWVLCEAWHTTQSNGGGNLLQGRELQIWNQNILLGSQL